jgi:hypothetical protein
VTADTAVFSKPSATATCMFVEKCPAGILRDCKYVAMLSSLMLESGV